MEANPNAIKHIPAITDTVAVLYNGKAIKIKPKIINKTPSTLL